MTRDFKFSEKLVLEALRAYIWPRDTIIYDEEGGPFATKYLLNWELESAEIKPGYDDGEGSILILKIKDGEAEMKTLPRVGLYGVKRLP